jgi:hypothetical protein
MHLCLAIGVSLQLSLVPLLSRCADAISFFFPSFFPLQTSPPPPPYPPDVRPSDVDDEQHDTDEEEQ